MASSSLNRPATDSASMLRNTVGSDPTATFEDDPTFVASDPTGNASSQNLGAVVDDDDEDVEEDDLEDDDLDDEDDEFEGDDLDEEDDEEDEDEDIEDEDEEAAA